jgi:hypothetical protein
MKIGDSEQFLGVQKLLTVPDFHFLPCLCGSLSACCLFAIQNELLHSPVVHIGDKHDVL